jgi:hypothetical protein
VCHTNPSQIESQINLMNKESIGFNY